MQIRLISLITVAFTAVMTIAQIAPVIVPKPLKPGARIALVTPASAIKSEQIDTAIIKLREQGYEPVAMPHAYGKGFGSYATTDEERAAELMQAFRDSTIDAVMCTRGGYGTVRLLPLLDMNVVRQHPKWLIGYSDISDLHAFMYKAGVASIHGPMCGHIATEPDTLAATQYLYQVLAQGLPLQYDIEPHKYNKYGTAKGRLVGGNLLTINGLAETPYDVMNIGDQEDVILFVEDVGEAIYAIERVLMRMQQSGALGRLKGLIIGQFNKYNPDDDFESMEDMFHYWLEKWGYYDSGNIIPIVFDFPSGHVSNNYPMVVNAMATLTVTPEGSRLVLSE